MTVCGEIKIEYEHEYYYVDASKPEPVRGWRILRTTTDEFIGLLDKENNQLHKVQESALVLVK